MSYKTKLHTYKVERECSIASLSYTVSIFGFLFKCQYTCMTVLSLLNKAQY